MIFKVNIIRNDGTIVDKFKGDDVLTCLTHPVINEIEKDFILGSYKSIVFKPVRNKLTSSEVKMPDDKLISIGNMYTCQYLQTVKSKDSGLAHEVAEGRRIIIMGIDRLTGDIEFSIEGVLGNIGEIRYLISKPQFKKGFY